MTAINKKKHIEDVSREEKLLRDGLMSRKFFCYYHKRNYYETFAIAKYEIAKWVTRKLGKRLMFRKILSRIMLAF